jgi:hypothetical protein
VRIRIIKRPTTGDCDLEGFDVSHFQVGEVYDLGPRLAELLIVCGYAEPEMRQRARPSERQKKS